MEEEEEYMEVCSKVGSSKSFFEVVWPFILAFFLSSRR